MPDFVPTVDALRARLATFVPSTLPALPFYWPNGEIEPSLANAPNGYVYSEVNGVADDQISIGGLGSREFRARGELTIWVVVPRASRAGNAEIYAQEIRAHFQPTELSSVVILDRSIGQGRVSGAINGPNGGAWAIPIVVEWFSDRTE